MGLETFMKNLTAVLRSAYTYIFLLTFYGVWLCWGAIQLPYRDHAGIISYLPTIQYNPTSNILRFLFAVLLPPLACFGFWLLVNAKSLQKLTKNKRLIFSGKIILTLACLLLCVGMGIYQNSTNPANNPVGTYGEPYKYALVDTFHEGETLAPALAYQQPNLKPYRDFVPIHGVFQDTLRTVLAFKFFGQSIGASRAFTTILIIITYMLYFLLLLVIFKGNLLKSALGLSLIGLALLSLPGLGLLNKIFIPVQFPFRDIPTILFLISAITGIRYWRRKRFALFALCSFAIGFIVMTTYAVSIDRAFYITFLSLGWLLMLLILSPFRSFLKYTVAPYIFGLIVGIPVLGLALKWAFRDFIVYTLTMSRYKEYLDGIIFKQPNMSVSILLLIMSVGVFIGGSYLVKIWSEKKLSTKNWSARIAALRDNTADLIQKHYIVILLFVTAAVFLRSAIGRSDVSHFAYTVQWTYLLLSVLLVNYLFSSKLKLGTAINYLTILLLGIVLLAFSIQVKKIDIAHDAFPIHLKDSEIVRPDYLETAAFLKQNMHGSDTFVTLTSEGIWYYLADKPSPIRYFIIWYAYTGAQRQEIAGQLNSMDNVKYVVTNNNWTSNFDFVPNPQRFPEVYSVLNEKYEPLTGFGQQTVWVRK